jgi:putative oxidoreductase
MEQGRLPDHQGRSTVIKWINLLLRIVLGGVFLLSGIVKIWNVQVKTPSEDRGAITLQLSRTPDHSKFAEDVLNYRVPPRSLNHLVAITLPWIELVAGALLMLGIWVRPSACVIGLMMVVFVIAIGQAVARGLNIDCGCFGTLEGRKVGLIALAEDTVMLAMAAWLFRSEKD